MSLMYSSALEITSIMACGRNCASIFDSVSSLELAPPRMSAVVMTCLTLQASPMIAAAAALSPAVATITTRSAVLTSSTRSLVRPARSLSHPPMEKRSPCRGAPENEDAVRKEARCHWEPARSLTTCSLGASSAITLTARGCELGRLMRNLASAAELIRADSLCIPALLPAFLDIAGPRPYFIMSGVMYNGARPNRKPPPSQPSPSSKPPHSPSYVRNETHRAVLHRRGRARRGAAGRDRRSDARGVQRRRRVFRYRRPVHPRAGLAIGRLSGGRRHRV